MALRKRAFAIAITPLKKRVKVTSSQPATGSIQPSSPPQSSRLSPRKALVESSQAPTFESQLRETQAEAEIIAPLESSEAATIAPSSTADDGAIDEALDESLEDQFDGINWQRLRLYMKPLSSARARKSWVFKYGWRVALLKDPDRIFFVCFYCHKHKALGGVYETTRAPSAAARHLEEKKRGHGYKAPSKAAAVQSKSTLWRAINNNKIAVSQGLANELSGFSTQTFRLAAVSWLVENNHPLSEFKTPAFRQLIAHANPEAEQALWTSHMSVSRYVLRLYNHIKPRVVRELSQALSKVHISFDGWTTKGGKRGFLGVVAHYVDYQGNVQDLPIALPQLTSAHSGEAMA